MCPWADSGLSLLLCFSSRVHRSRIKKEDRGREEVQFSASVGLRTTFCLYDAIVENELVVFLLLVGWGVPILETAYYCGTKECVSIRASLK